MPRRWFGALTVAVGLVSSVLALTLFVASWDSFLRMTGLLYLHVEFNRSVNVTIDQTNQLQVNTSGSYDKKNNVSTVTTLGQVEVVLSRNDKELAIWNGQGTIQNNPIKGVLVDGDQVVGVLRSQIPRDSDSPFAGILHNEEDAAILARTIESYADTNGSVSSYVMNSQGKKMFDGGISSSSGGSSGLVWPSEIWFVPIYVISFVICGLFLMLGLRILLYRRSLQPFEPQASMV
ncbi:MAG: hypothetical protein P8J45_05520 [Phycisphaerales bacterium]|nr:hypothetical protein [Phycisphaerales bacterium]